MITVAVDASVVVKWYLPEATSPLARALLSTEPSQHLIAPDLLLAEVGNVLWKRWRRGDLIDDEVEAITEAMSSPHTFPVDLIATSKALRLASNIARGYGCTVYDGLYVAAAIMSNAKLITADSKLVELLRTTPLGAHLVLLDEYKPTPG